MSRTALKCSCGQRIGQKDVMQTGYYMRMMGPSFVYVKFRCSRCKKLGEQFVKQEVWEDGIFEEAVVERTASEKRRFEALGPINLQEMADFHSALEQPDSLNLLNGELRESRKPAPGERNDR